MSGRRRPREATEAARTLPDSPPCATGTCAEDCLTRDFPPREVDIPISEVISGAPTAYASWNGTYGWQSKYMLTMRRNPCSVLLTMRLKVSGAAMTAAQKTAWKNAIEAKWNNKVRFMCPDTRCAGACGAGYPVSVEVQYVEANFHYEITAHNPGATTGGRAGLGGTISMTGWGVNDLIDITHEFGHMIGNPEEYFTTDGFDYRFGDWRINGFRDPGGGNMNNPQHDPASRNYQKIREQASIILGGANACTLNPPPAPPTNPNPMPIPPPPPPPAAATPAAAAASTPAAPTAGTGH